MRRSAKSIVGLGLTLAVLAPVIPAGAADIEVQATAQGGQVIRVTGRLNSGDGTAFRVASGQAPGATVLFDGSAGGNLQAGLTMGRAIRAHRMRTYVSPGSFCYSSCALAWLAGSERMKEPQSRIGFHAAGDADHNYSADGTAMIDAYVRDLGLGENATRFITAAGPHDLSYLTQDNARQVGVTVSWVRP